MGFRGRSLRAILGAPGRPALGILPSRTSRPRWSAEYPLSRDASTSENVVSSRSTRVASRSSAQRSIAVAGVSPP